MPNEEKPADAPWKIETMGEEGIELMYAACQSAQKSIDCEQFIFADDDTGTRFLELFLEKAEAGVKIRLHCDMVGSFSFYASEWPGTLRDAGIDVRFFRIISPWRIGNFNGWYLRTHRKILVVDGEQAISGGLGIRDDMREWRDTTFALRGKIVAELRESFQRMWDSTEDEIFLRFRRYRDYADGFRVATNAPHFRQRHIYRNLLEKIQGAKSSITLATPYFTPNHRFTKSLRDAAERGVAVKILLPDKANKLWLSSAADSYLSRLLNAGIRIFKYEKAFMHAKGATVDGAWASVGSFNLDGQSFFWNYETNVESVDRDFVGRIEKNFEEDLRDSEEVLRHEWIKRPFYRKLLEKLTFPFLRIL